jgi:pteridine reductase
VHNASLFSEDPPQFDRKWWDPLWTVNVTAPYMLTTLMHDALAAHRGSIVYITDARTSPIASYNAYYQTKAALTAQACAFAKAFAPKIRVNMVAPGSIIWPEGDNSLTIEEKKHIETHIPLGICSDPSVIAQAVLSCIDNLFMTGVILPVDGGARLSRNSP